MSQTFTQLQARLARGVQRDDLLSLYGEIINEARRETQNRRSFSLMKKTVEVTVPTGEGSETIALPADFKELQKRPAVHYITDDGQFVPAELVTEEQQIHRVWAFGGTPIATWPPRVFFERDADGAHIGVVEPITTELNFRVKYYAYLPDLVDGTDTCPLTNAYPKMILAKAKAIAFSEINDEIAAGFEAEFEKKLAEAVRQDAYSEVSGRELRM